MDELEEALSIPLEEEGPDETDIEAVVSAPVERPDLSVIEKLAKRWNRGADQVVKANQGFDALFGKGDIDEVNARFSQLDAPAYNDAVSTKHEDAPFFSVENLLVGPAARSAVRFGEESVLGAVESTPFMIEAGKTGLATGAGAASAAAGTAALSALLFGAAAPTPEEAVSIPVAAGTAAASTFGPAASVGYGVASSRLMAGLAYSSLVARGFDKNQAKPVALGAGIVMGVIETAQFKGLSTAATQALKMELAGDAGKTALRAFVEDYVGEVAKQVTEEELQALTELAAFGLEAALEGDMSKAPDIEEVITTILETGAQSVGPSAVMVGGAKGAGLSANVGLNGTAGLLDIVRGVQKKDIVYSAAEAVAGAQTGVRAVGEISKSIVKGDFDRVRQAFSQLRKKKPQGDGASFDTRANELETTRQLGKTGVLWEPELDNTIVVNTEATTIKAGVSMVKDLTPDATGAVEVEGGVVSAQGEGVLIDPNAANQEPETGKVRVAKTKLENPAFVVGPDELEALGGIPALKEAGHDGVVIKATTNQTRPMVIVFDTTKLKEKEAQSIVRSFSDYKVEEDQIAQGRLRQLRSEAAALAKDIKATEKLFSERDAAGKSTVAVTTKLEKLYASLDENLTERDSIEAGAFQPTKGSKIQLDAAQVNKQRAQALERRVGEFARGVKEGTKITLDQVANIQNEIASVVRTSGLSEKSKAKFLATLKNTQTAEDFAKALPVIKNRVAQLLEQESKAVQRKRLGGLLRRSKLTQSGKFQKGKYSAPVQKVLDYYRLFATDPKRAEALVKNIVDKWQSQPDLDFSAEDSLVLNIADRMARLKSMSAKELAKINDELERLIEEGKHSAFERQEAKREAAKKDREMAFKHLVDPKTISRVQAQKLWERTKKLAGNIKRQALTWDQLMYSAAAYSSNADEFVNYMDAHSAVREEAKATQDAFALATGLFETAVGKKKATKLLVGLNSDTVDDLGTYTNTWGEIRQLELTKGEALKLWMLLQDETLVDTIRGGVYEADDGTVTRYGNGYPPSVDTMVETYLGEDGIALGKAFLQFYESYYDVINPVWETRTGASLPKTKNYSPGRRAFSAAAATEETLAEHVIDRLRLTPSSAIARVKSRAKLVLRSPADELREHVVTWSHYIGYQPFVDRVKNVFQDPDVREHVKLVHGKSALDSIDLYFRNFIGDRMYMYNSAVSLFGLIRRNLPTAALGLKLDQAFKQGTAIVNFLEYVSIFDLARYTADYYANPNKFKTQVFDKSPILQKRYTGGVNIDLERLGKGDRLAGLVDSKSLTEVFMKPIEIGDKHLASSPGAWAVYNMARKKGATEEEAIIAAEKAVDSTQQSANLNRLNAIQQNNHPMVQLFLTVFQSQPWQMLGKELNALDRLVYGPKTVANITHQVKVLFLYHVVSPLIYSYIAHFGATDDEAKDDYLKAIIAGPLGQIGTFAYMVEQLYGLGKTVASAPVDSRPFSFESPLEKPLNLTRTVFSRLKKTIKSPAQTEEKDIYWMLHDTAFLYSLLAPKGIGGGLPIQNAVNAGTNALEIARGKYNRAQVQAAILGATPTRVAKMGSNSDNESTDPEAKPKKKKRVYSLTEIGQTNGR